MSRYRWSLFWAIIAAALLTGYSIGRASGHSTSSSSANIAWQPIGTPMATGSSRDSRPEMRDPDGVPTSSLAPAVASPRPTSDLRAGVSMPGHIAIATWYCGRRCTVGYPPGCLCAAASPDLHLRGKAITVSYQGRSVRVRVVDCLCSRSGLDLYAAAFAQLAPLSLGRIKVSWWP